MRRAFTLIELVVALGVLAIILSFAGVIFRVSIDAQRLAMANAEIMQKFRVITQQLDADFRGRIPEYGGALSAQIWTVDPNQVTWRVDPTQVTVNSDVIAFFACGDFQSTEQYRDEKGTLRTAVGNVAAIFYGQPDPSSYAEFPAPRERLLLRRQTILVPKPPGGPGPSDLPLKTDPRAEYYSDSLSQWWFGPPFVDANDWARRPVIVPVGPVGVHLYQPMYLAEGVGDFAIRYLPSDANVSDLSNAWQPESVADSDGQAGQIPNPRALKFTFRLYDSNGIIENGRTFTHIVPWGS